MYRNLLIVTSYFIYATYADPVSFITKCNSNDAKCAKDSTKAATPVFAPGLPDLGIAPSDPLSLKFIDASSPNLKFLLHDVVVKGLKNCLPNKVQRDNEKATLTISLLCDATLDGQYELSGQMLFIPIEGKGAIHVDLRKALINVDADLSFKDGKDGKQYWNIKKWNYTYQLKGKSDVNFANLFDGNDVLGRASKELLANSGNDIIMEIGTPVIKAVISEVVKNINQLFHKMPYEELSID